MISKFINRYLKIFDIEIVGNHPYDYKYVLYFKYIWQDTFHKVNDIVYNTVEDIHNAVENMMGK